MPRNGMSEYELDRLERIKENEKMLNELFPKGTSLKQPKTVKRRRQTDTNSLGTGSGTSGSGSEEENSELGTSKPKRTFQQMKVRVTPRRNPTRRARPDDCMSDRPVTRSITKATNEGVGLVGPMEDDQDVKRTVYRTIRRRVSTDTEELPIELDDVPAYSSTRHINVLERNSDKVYDSVRGTTCHQCRQKTIDTKTVCHNKNCRGVRGQFCAPCLLNRYGEGLVESLRDKKWVCPPCRKICNCSFCLPKRGLAPTGIMIHEAREAGCDNVHEYLNKTDYL